MHSDDGASSVCPRSAGAHSPYSPIRTLYQAHAAFESHVGTSPRRRLDRLDPRHTITSGREELVGASKSTAATRRRRRASKRKAAAERRDSKEGAPEDAKHRRLKELRILLLGRIATVQLQKRELAEQCRRLQTELAFERNENVSLVDKDSDLRKLTAQHRAEHQREEEKLRETNAQQLDAAQAAHKEHVLTISNKFRRQIDLLRQQLAAAQAEVTKAQSAETRLRSHRDLLLRAEERAAAIIGSLRRQLQQAGRAGANP